MKTGEEKEKSKNRKQEKKSVQQVQKEKEKTSRRSPPSRSGDVIRVLVKDGQSYAEIQKVMKVRANSSDAGLEVLSV